MSEDKTYCHYLECQNKKCKRHPSHIMTHDIPHSFSFFKDCEYWDYLEVFFATRYIKSKEDEMH